VAEGRARVEGLGQIVVGPDFEADDAIDVLAAGGRRMTGTAERFRRARRISNPFCTGSITLRMTSAKRPPAASSTAPSPVWCASTSNPSARSSSPTSSQSSRSSSTIKMTRGMAVRLSPKGGVRVVKNG